MTYYARIGEISSGTLRLIDLIDSFGDALRPLATRNNRTEHFALCDEADAMWSRLSEGDLSEGGQAADSEASDVVARLEEALDEYAPPYAYFGSHGGDGACVGFWPCVEQLEEDARAGEVIKINDLSEYEINVVNGAAYVMLVNDHGNVTLFGIDNADNGNLIELWSIV